VETVFDHRLVNVVFIDLNGRQQAGRDIFEAVVERGVGLRLLIVAQLDGDFSCGGGKVVIGL
jgi:hypothetical protein